MCNGELSPKKVQLTGYRETRRERFERFKRFISPSNRRIQHLSSRNELVANETRASSRKMPRTSSSTAFDTRSSTTSFIVFQGLLSAVFLKCFRHLYVILRAADLRREMLFECEKKFSVIIIRAENGGKKLNRTSLFHLSRT